VIETLLLLNLANLTVLLLLSSALQKALAAIAESSPSLANISQHSLSIPNSEGFLIFETQFVIICRLLESANDVGQPSNGLAASLPEFPSFIP
jgi:hypothetical protein